MIGFLFISEGTNLKCFNRFIISILRFLIKKSSEIIIVLENLSSHYNSIIEGFVEIV